MRSVEAILALGLFVVLPVRGTLTHRRLEARLGVDPAEPARTFRRSAAIKWGLSVVAFVVLYADLGLLLVGDWVALVIPFAIGIVGGAAILRLRLNTPEGQDKIAGQLGGAAALLPTTQHERRQWVFFSVTAGVTEELLYRAFLVVYLYDLVPALGLLGSAAVAAVAFALAHLYQGWRGVLLTGVLGFVFGWLYPWSGLLVLVVVHTLIDLRVLLVPPEVVLRARAARRPPPRPPPPPPPNP